MGQYISCEAPTCGNPFKKDEDKIGLSPAQRLRLLDIFDSLDADGNGELDLHEFSLEMKVRVFHMLGYNPAEEHVEQMFQELDSNGDGIIDFSEFSSWILTSMGKPKNTVLHSVFDMFDTNRDGKITPEELKAAFDQAGESHISLGMCRDIVFKVDKNGDGVIEYKEFKKMWKKFLKKNGGMTPLTMQAYSTSAENIQTWNMSNWDSQSTIGDSQMAEEDLDHLLIPGAVQTYSDGEDENECEDIMISLQKTQPSPIVSESGQGTTLSIKVEDAFSVEPPTPDRKVTFNTSKPGAVTSI